MSSEDDSSELLAVSATSSANVSSTNLAADQLLALSKSQYYKTDTFSKKLWQFVRIMILGQKNTFEEYVLTSEPNDCSLIAKYTKIVDVDLTSQPSLSVDSVTLNSIHIPHPLVNFMRNEANQMAPEDIDLSRELDESPILVFIHGLGGQMSQFEPLFGLLSQCSEIVSLDLPGFGNSKLTFDSYSKSVSVIEDSEKERISKSIKSMSWDDFKTENIVNIVYEFIQQNIPKEKKVVLIGHSMGTHLSVKVAAKLPKQKVEGLILLSPPSFTDDVIQKETAHNPKTLSMLSVFSYLPWFFNSFRVWDRLEGLESSSVLRQLAKVDNISTGIYNKLRQLRWNMDVNSNVVLKYVNGFQKAKYSDLLTAISQFNDNAEDKTVYEKTLFIGGSEDKLTSPQVIHKTHEFLTKTFDRKVSEAIEINGAGHSLLIAKPEFISGMILNHVEAKFPERLHLSPAWVLKVKARISGDKWGLKNELKWSQLKPISTNITRHGGKDIAPLLGMKTLREEDLNHSPTIVEEIFYGPNKDNRGPQYPAGNLIAIVDISADIPPYSPKSFKKIKYYKCSTVSKVVPDQVAIRRFIQLIDDILSTNEDDDPLIAVHCHYGFNRTGFLICCYLVEKLGWSVQEAVEGFRVAKAPGIKHPHFIDALYVRYES
ncbi:uncharacterized protein RJT20DRAFT_131480 [Scheffersomyces xylosifermentans]|uniref:uncharacterized protein n=1 Tax=Scheffersomyces xylosifermentans TaxID=1304137 RepID=UPI00315CB235